MQFKMSIDQWILNKFILRQLQNIGTRSSIKKKKRIVHNNLFHSHLFLKDFIIYYIKQSVILHIIHFHYTLINLF